ncbi:MAG: Beta-hexosaminidase [Candidatus Hydrogenedentes bacterium ADurb.Bin101]|nr:MAG: Beta-hexosaminidase [Candidatus Hydrogenedentes bacterium ADurb.Bin101]HOC68312.1 glycoside hydrolase family 20 zincin-like fold domain-containing protein [Candidatus Hydrogenedentota bacterium]
MIVTTRVFVCGLLLCTPAVCDNGLFDTLLPVPQEIQACDGVFPLTAETFRFSLTTPSPEETAPLGDRLRESLERLSLPDALEISDGGLFRLVMTVSDEPVSQPKDPAPLPEKARAEGYCLAITPTHIVIHAPSEKGLFYGMMTLEQLLLSAKAHTITELPCAVIRDWPALSMRGFSEDYGRDQLPTLEEHKRSIRHLARFKVNTYLWFIEPDHFVYAFDPDISTDYDRFTFEEIRELVAYAKRYYMEIIPTVELLGHMEQTLRHDRYKPLAEMPGGGGDLCAACEDSFGLVTKMVNEIAPAFGGRYFHCGLDESYTIGKGRSEQAVKETGIERVFADYYTKMNDLVKSHGQTMMMYADIVLNHPAMIDLLPKDIIMMFWDYAPREEYPGLTALRAKGLPVTALSGLWSWNNLYPLYPPAFKNMEILAAQAEKEGALGHFVSTWGDGYKGAAGINLNEWDQYGVAYCAALSWNTTPVPMDAFSRAFAAQFFGSADPAMAEALTRLARCQGEDLSRVCQARQMLHCDPDAAVWSMAGADDATLSFWNTLATESASVHTTLSAAKPALNADHLATLGLAARLLHGAAEMALAFQDIGTAMAKADFNREEAAARLDALAENHEILWEAYRQAWLATNRPLNLVHLGRVWSETTTGMSRLAGEIRSGGFPAVPEKGLQAAFTFDGKGGEAWKDDRDYLTLVPVVDGLVPEITAGGPSETGGCLHLDHGARCEAVDGERRLDLRTAPLLVEAWVRHTGQQEQEYGATIVSYGLGGGWRLGLNHKGETLFTLYGIGEQAGTKSILPPDGQWHHVAVNFRECRVIDFYIDGALTEQLELPGYPRSPSNPLLRIGNEIALVTPFAGDIDRIRISTGRFEAKELDR